MNEDDGDFCSHCGNSLIYEDCYRCAGAGGFDDADDTGGRYGAEWEDCDACDGTGVTTFCPNAVCPGKDKVGASGTSADNRIATSVATRNVTETTTPQRPPIVDRQPDPGIRARRKTRKAERQNRQHGRQHPH